MGFMTGYRRPPEKVDEILVAVRDALEAHPTQRFGQILSNATEPRVRVLGLEVDLFNVHDEDMILALERYRDG